MERTSISVRVHPVGPPLATAVAPALQPGFLPNGRAAVLVLIHGYNVDQADALSAYGAFLDRMEQAAGRPIAMCALQFFWPGDETGKLLSTLSYPLQLKVASQAAPLLERYLSGVSGPGGTPIDVHFVAHSLGNRLLLDLLSSATLPVNMRVASVTSMAAAVPVSRVQNGATLYVGCRRPHFIQVMHSRADSVLHYAFPAGQTLAGDSFFPQAVGRYGDPGGNWTRSCAFDSFEHGDYWLKPGPAEQVLGCLGLATARTLPARTLPQRRISTG
jgi:hypothetical protein